MGQLAGFELLVPRDHQQVKRGALAVAQQQVLADHRAQRLINPRAVLHGHGRFMIDALVGNAKAVQKIVDPDLFVKPPGAVGRSSLNQFHCMSFFPYCSFFAV